MINMDSQAPNKAVGEWLKRGGIFPYIEEIRAEKKYGNSRFDFFVRGGELMAGTREAFVEVKGVTLEEDGTAWFPDAPTERGVKHIEELIHCVEEGYDAYIIFVIQMKGVHCFRPNDRTHRAFGDTLRKAADSGVHILALDCRLVCTLYAIKDHKGYDQKHHQGYMAESGGKQQDQSSGCIVKNDHDISFVDPVRNYTSCG